ncbi:hypothetical protein [Nitratidesulfovibrio termitidis]|uniref:hypothetical protein n=1 Tax=Nitratidesulfovibrio termitidis TaxID=42252 RepID=UPI00054F6C53|nr:hypothetical protein [Nitratidesulfovibrio termitidis]
MKTLIVILATILVNLVDPLMWLAAIPAWKRPHNTLLVGLGGVAVAILNFLLVRSMGAPTGMQFSSADVVGKVAAALLIAYGVAALRRWRLRRAAAKADDQQQA